MSPLSNEANDPPVLLPPPKVGLVAPPKPENAEVVEADFAANPPKPPDMFPTGVVEGLAGPAAGAGVDGFPKAEEPNPEEPNPEAEGVGVVDTGFENAFGVVEDPNTVGAGLEVGVVEL
ncbi:MAG: hypothetical protein EOO40_06095 [Deltaproteobacteria bacterium]|nr:MAG: hypothetical protein EOO40_06095 [Deltaproteobacteria bacterium]